MATTNKSIGERIREARGRMPQKELARRINVTERTISRYENGETEPDAPKMTEIAHALSTTVRWLQTGEGTMRADNGRSFMASVPRAEVDSGGGMATSSNLPAGYTKGHPALNQVARHIDYELLGPDGEVRMRVTIVVEAADTRRSWQNRPH